MDDRRGLQVEARLAQLLDQARLHVQDGVFSTETWSKGVLTQVTNLMTDQEKQAKEAKEKLFAFYTEQRKVEGRLQVHLSEARRKSELHRQETVRQVRSQASELEALKRQLSLYTTHLGIEVRAPADGSLVFILTQLIASDPNRQCSFTVSMDEAEQFVVDSVDPPVECRDVITELVKTNNIRLFLCRMRRLFVEHLSRS